jgi:hypothetical protein
MPAKGLQFDARAKGDYHIVRFLLFLIINLNNFFSSYKMDDNIGVKIVQNFANQQGVGGFFKNSNFTEIGTKLDTFLLNVVRDIKLENMVIKNNFIIIIINKK